MGENTDFAWNDGERNRELDVYRPCSCGTCSRGRKGVGYLSYADGKGQGFSIWLEEEEVYRRLETALRRFKKRSSRDQK